VTKAGTNKDIATEVPWSQQITDYDRAHLALYLRLLDASAEGASTDEMARIVLGIDPVHDAERHKRR
jgi:hypothetical protein